MTRYLTEWPPAVQWLSFECGYGVEVGQTMGPNEMGEYLTVVEISDSADTDTGIKAGLAYGVINRIQLEDPS